MALVGDGQVSCGGGTRLLPAGDGGIGLGVDVSDAADVTVAVEHSTLNYKDGLIIAETQRIDPRIDYLIEKDIPFATFGRSESGSGYPWVDLDFGQVAADAVAHLLQGASVLGRRALAPPRQVGLGPDLGERRPQLLRDLRGEAPPPAPARGHMSSLRDRRL